MRVVPPPEPLFNAHCPMPSYVRNRFDYVKQFIVVKGPLYRTFLLFPSAFVIKRQESSHIKIMIQNRKYQVNHGLTADRVTAYVNLSCEVNFAE